MGGVDEVSRMLGELTATLKSVQDDIKENKKELKCIKKKVTSMNLKSYGLAAFVSGVTTALTLISKKFIIG